MNEASSDPISPKENKVRLNEDPIFGARSDIADKEKILSILQVKRENTRHRIALIIVISMSTIVIFSYLCLIFVNFFGDHKVSFSDLKELTEVLITPIIGIVGAVAGFYFGEKQSEE